MIICERCCCMMAGHHCPTCGHIQNQGVTRMNYNEIAENAFDVVLNCLMTNDDKHGDGWQLRSDGKDVAHIIQHLRNHLMADDSDTHLENSITRLALMLARRKRDT